jgi:hypothetical protein
LIRARWRWKAKAARALMAGDVDKAIDGFRRRWPFSRAATASRWIWPRPRGARDAGQGAALLPPRADQRSAKS